MASYGWALIPEYTFEAGPGLWNHRRGKTRTPNTLSALRVGSQGATWDSSRHRLGDAALADHLAEGRRILMDAVRGVPEPVAAAALPEPYDAMRWFPLPHEVAGWLRRRKGANGPETLT